MRRSVVREAKQEVLALVTEWVAKAQIAARLELSEKTVRNHVPNKLGVHSRAQAIVFAHDRGGSGAETWPHCGPAS